MCLQFGGDGTRNHIQGEQTVACRWVISPVVNVSQQSKKQLYGPQQYYYYDVLVDCLLYLLFSRRTSTETNESQQKELSVANILCSEGELLSSTPLPSYFCFISLRVERWFLHAVCRVSGKFRKSWIEFYATICTRQDDDEEFSLTFSMVSEKRPTILHQSMSGGYTNLQIDPHGVGNSWSIHIPT